MTTNYADTFIRVAPDTRATAPQIPPAGKTAATVAQLQYELLVDAAYTMTSDELLFAVHAIRTAIPEADQAQARVDFFAKPQACLRSSPLAKRYGWGFHHDADSRVAIVPMGSTEYEQFSEEPRLHQVVAMRSSRR